jgi:UDPglucose 6-dehydrogenase
LPLAPFILNLSSNIVANRITDDIRDVADKIYSRDLFGKD